MRASRVSSWEKIRIKFGTIKFENLRCLLDVQAKQFIGTFMCDYRFEGESLGSRYKFGYISLYR